MSNQKVGRIELEPIAIVGIGCRFPGAASPSAYWRLLCDGVDAIGTVPADRWDADAWYDPDPAAPGKMTSRSGGFLSEIDQFDPEFFGIAPREAELMDPQQRLLLEVAWEALEDAAIDPATLAGTSTGVFVGVSSNNYATLLYHDPSEISALSNSGSSQCIVSNRVSYCLDLRGPSMAVDTACSSSLVAVHMACQSLWTGESTLAVAGGVNVILSPGPSVGLTKSRILSPDGRCRVFDAGANGFVRGEGAGAIVLKPLSRALADGDPICAIIRGTAVQQGGRTNGLMAPSRWAQEAVILEACRRAGVSPGLLRYVEAHSSASPIGDATELNALGTVLKVDRPDHDKCAIGSVKTNIGHLEAAAGIAGLIKVALMLRHRALPPSLHFKTPNPQAPYADLPLRVQQELEPWPASDARALAGVGSSGFGGVNVHAVLEAAPSSQPQCASSDAEAGGGERTRLLLTLSARCAPALKELASRYLARLEREPAERIADLCFTTNTGRTAFSHRLVAVGASAAELSAALTAFTNDQPASGLFTGVATRATAKAAGPASLETDAIALRFVQGAPIDWTAVHAARPELRRTGSLPTYPFQRQRHWVNGRVLFAVPPLKFPTVAADLPAPSIIAAAPSAVPSSRQIVPPQTDVESALVQMWRQILGTPHVGITDNFFELGGGSIMAIELFEQIELMLGVRPSPAILFEKPTIGELAAAITADDAVDEPERLVSTIRPGGSRPPLFLLTPGHLFQFASLARKIEPDRPIYGMSFPIRFSTPGITIEQIAQGYITELERLCPSGPFHLFGFCAAGIVAYELAQRLIERGRTPGLVAMVDAPCPPRHSGARLGRIGYFWSRVAAHARAARARGPRGAVGYIAGRGKFLPNVLRLPGFRAARPEQLATVAHREAIHRYRPMPYPNALDLYLAEVPWPSAAEDTRLEWRKYAPAGHNEYFPGIHDGLLKEPTVADVAGRLNASIAACDADSRGRELRYDVGSTVTRTIEFRTSPVKAYARG